MTDYSKTVTDFMKSLTDAVPTVAATSSGYEIRTKILGLAQHQAHRDFEFKSAGDGAGFRSTDENGERVYTVTYPTAEEVLKIAEEFNNFVSGTRNKTDK
jgi:hypothetical protein|tara:strand:- start:145 stop:444 length:300 start_codon:yes stop_codon:yes gene_type:complete